MQQCSQKCAVFNFPCITCFAKNPLFKINSTQIWFDFCECVPDLPHLHFGLSFDLPLPPLPFELISLKFDYKFDQSIPNNFLPNNISYLSFSYMASVDFQHVKEKERKTLVVQ
eukprot:TRINITY_DN3604_c0_g1_i1.p1 TRINITY_DN3604_c0_g1~~TRINITY_DN3604_c0_g1_i1.p1  ORF type:complete len:113 (-),score=11.00 TRINITY_DN3604_c0_g1_i1:87-425(-)